MSLFRSIKIALVAIPLALTSALADAVDVEAVASGGYWTRDEQLRLSPRIPLTWTTSG